MRYDRFSYIYLLFTIFLFCVRCAVMNVSYFFENVCLEGIMHDQLLTYVEI